MGTRYFCVSEWWTDEFVKLTRAAKRVLVLYARDMNDRGVVQVGREAERKLGITPAELDRANKLLERRDFIKRNASGDWVVNRGVVHVASREVATEKEAWMMFREETRVSAEPARAALDERQTTIDDRIAAVSKEG